MQQFRLPRLPYALALAAAGALIALTVEFASVTFVRIVGMVVLGPRTEEQPAREPLATDPGLTGRGGMQRGGEADLAHDLEGVRPGKACWIVTMAGVAARRRLTIRTAFPRARNRSQPTELPALARSLRSSRVWVGTVVLGVLGTLLTGVLLALPGQLLNPLSTKDRLRSGPDFSAGIEVVRLDDEGRSAVTQEEFRPSAAQVRMLARPNSATTAGFTGLLRSIGAVNLDTVTVRVTLTGHRNQQIDVEDIRPLIVARSAPLSGSLLCVPSQGGAPTMNMLFDMDRPFPVAHDLKFGNDAGTDDGGTQQEGLGPPFFAQRTITLQDNEQQVLLIRAVTRQHYVAFRLEATYMLGSQKKKAVIDDHGEPFRVSALVPTPAGGTPVYRSVYAMRADFSLRRIDTSALATPGGAREGSC